MADGGFDPCECVWSHELALRRLLLMLRQSQSYCTDTECYEELPGPSPDGPNGIMENTSFFIMVWAMMAVLLFFLRPSTLRSDPNLKPSNNNQDGGSPPEPPMAN